MILPTLTGFARITACASLILSLAACSVTGQSTPQVNKPPTAPAAVTAEMVTAPPSPSPTAVATVTPAATETPESTSTSPATSPATGPTGVITAQSAANLTPTTVTLPEWPAQLLWTGPDTQIPGLSAPVPPLIALAELKFYPVQLDPPGVGQPVPVQVPGNMLVFSPGLTSALSVGSSSPAVLFDLSGKQLLTLGQAAPYAAAFSPDGKLAAITAQNEIAAFIYDTASGQLLTKLSGFQTAAPVYGVGFVPGNQVIYWISRATLQFQDIKTGQLGQALHYEDFIGPIAFTPDGARLILSVAGKLYLYSVPDAKQLAEISLSQPVNSLSISPDGKLVAGGYGPNIQLWNAATLTPAATLKGPNDFSGQVAFSPDGKYLVSIHTGNLLTVWK